MTIHGVTSVFPVALPTLMQAADPLAEARKHLKTGFAFLNREKYSQALAEFQKAYDLSGSPKVFVNIGTCYKAMGQSEKAIASYRLYLEKVPDASQRQEVEGIIAELEKKQAKSSPVVTDTYTPPPSTESNMDLAKKHFRTGKVLYEKKEYGAALDKFQTSYNLIHLLDTQYNIGLCYEKLGSYDKAIAALQLYVDGNPGKEEKEEAEMRIAWIQSQIKPQKKEETPRQAVAVVAPSEEQTPPPKQVPAVNTKIAKKIKKEKIRVPADETWKMPHEEIASAPPKAVIPPIPARFITDTYPPPSQEFSQVDVTKNNNESGMPLTYRNLMWTSFGLSAVGLVAGITGHVLTLQTESEYKKWQHDLETRRDVVDMGNGKYKFTNPASESANASTENEYQNEFNTRKTVAYAGFISSAVFLGLGGIFYWLNRRDMRVVANPSSKGAQVGLELYFK